MTPPIAAQRDGVLLCFDTIKALLMLGYWAHPLSWTVVTRATEAVVDGDRVNAAHATLRGLFGSLAKEYPNWQVRVVDLDGGKDWPLREVFALRANPLGQFLAYRAHNWYQQHLLPLIDKSLPLLPLYKARGLYVLIGGAGGIGEVWSEWMIRHYQARIVWLGRRQRDEQIDRKLERLGKLGECPLYLTADCTDARAMERARDQIKEHYGPGCNAISGVLHSAIVLLDKSLLTMTRDQFEAGLRVKVDASVHLADIFGDEPLDFVAFFSSMQSFSKAAGQSNYAAGCTFVDAYAEQLREALPCAVKVVNWGYWGSVGIVATEAIKERMAAAGVGSIEPEEAMVALEAVLSGPWPQVGLVKFSHEVFFPAAAAHDPGSQIIVGRSDGVVRQQVPRSAVASTGPDHAQPAAAHPAADTRLRALAADYLKRLISSVLKLGAQQIDPARSLERYGLDSIVAVQLATALSQSLDHVGSMIFLEYPSVDALVDHLMETRADDLRGLLGIDIVTGGTSAPELDSAWTPAPGTHLPDTRPSATAPISNRFSPLAVPEFSFTRPATDIAIVGVAGRYAQASTIEDFWRVLAEGRDCVSEVPPSRWNHALYFDDDKSKFGKTCCKWGSFMDGVDEFDPLFFDITPASANALDPQVRLCMQTFWELLERSGYTRQSLRQHHHSRVGVFLGAMYQQYAMFDTDYVVNAAVALTSYSTITNRISSFFDFKGPSVAVDTQCSSSMIAVHMACRSLLDGECEVAIAGGVNLLLHPKKYIGLSMGFALASRSGSRSFNDGDGFVPAEGVGAVFLKPLARAIEDGDPVLAVIKYSGQSHGGHGIGYGTQDPNAQYELIQTSLRRSGVDARTISYVEAAANGTPLGDAIETSALIRAYRQGKAKPHSCAIGSVKSNLGHVEAASGIAQLTKVILQLQHRQIAPLLYPEPRNPHIDFSASPFYLATELQPWQRPMLEFEGRSREFPRRAAINTFGGGGSLAHLIVEEYAPDLYGEAAPSAPLDAPGPHLVLMSARTADRLRVVAMRLLDFVHGNEDESLADIVYSLQLGREAMEHRLAMVVEDVKELVLGLREFLDLSQEAPQPARPPQLYMSPPEGADDAASQCAAEALSQPLEELLVRRELAELANYWVQGGEVPWRQLHQQRRSHVVALPTYPFEQRRCWLKETTMTRYADSFINQGESSQEINQGETVEQMVYRTIGSMLGLTPDELKLEEPLARYELLSVLLPRLHQHLNSQTTLQIDPGLLDGCKTARDIIEAATCCQIP
jgi:3-oxoacyl-(acyl-carrier-protein) synthase/acyl carrier protein/NADP-dependent 3-hydroxy acid dehydrogenase YdfG